MRSTASAASERAPWRRLGPKRLSCKGALGRCELVIACLVCDLHCAAQLTKARASSIKGSERYRSDGGRQAQPDAAPGAGARAWRRCPAAAQAPGDFPCGNKRPESPRRPPRHRRDACSMAWRCRFHTGAHGERRPAAAAAARHPALLRRGDAGPQDRADDRTAAASLSSQFIPGRIDGVTLTQRTRRFW